MMPANKTNIPSENSLSVIVKQGYLKKLKTMKKRYFVLRGDSSETAALEYYENEKKFRTNCQPKRVILLKNCFNINRIADKKQKPVVGLYSRGGCFSIVFETEAELNEWLEALLRLQHEDVPDGETVKPVFEHVWEVEVLDRDMGSRMNILGRYHVCLTNQYITLIKASSDDSHSASDDPKSNYQFCLEKVRACGQFTSFFYMQVGNDTVTGAGNLWMTTGDAAIADSMHVTIMKACARCHQDPAPRSRIRSMSNNESSKPTHTIQRWPTHTGEGVTSPRTVSTLRASERRHSVAGLTQVRDTLPFGRERTTSEGNHLLRSRPYSVNIKANSPPVHSSLLSPVTATYSTDSAGSSMSMDGEGDWDEGSVTRFHSLTPDKPIIVEENVDEYSPWSQGEDEKLNNYMPMSSTGSVTNSSYRKISPTPYPQGFKSNSPSQGSLADVCTPASSSPLDSQSAYMPMSPVDARGSTYSGTHNHSRGSSIDDMGYMTTVPNQNNTAYSDDGYVNMGQKNNRERYQSCSNTSGGSSCSLATSGTPGDVTRISEHSLDRASSGIGPEELRPARAYSVGSRPHNANNKTESSGNGEEKRVRAFSFGSHQQVGNRLMASVSRLANSLRSQPPNPSAPLGSQSLSLSHSSFEPAEDLMYLDFTKRAKHIKNMRAAKKPSSVEKLSDSGLSPPKGNRLASLFGRSPPVVPVSPPLCHQSPLLGRVPETEPGYLEMTVQKSDSYMEMKPVVAPVKNSLKPQSFPKITSHQGSTGCSHQPPIKPALFSSKPSPDCYVDMNLKRKTSLVEDNNNSKIVISQNQIQTNNGYVEMHIKTNSPLPQKQESNYMNMSGGNKNEKRAHRKDRRFSQPIKIQAREVARKTLPVMVPFNNSQSAYGLGSSADSNQSIDSNKLETGSDESKNGSLESKVFVSVKSPCNACDYVMFQAPSSEGSTSDPMSDYTMMGPTSQVTKGVDTVDILRAGLVSVNLLDNDNIYYRHSEDEPTTDSSKSLSRASSTASVGEKEVEYASLDLTSDSDGLTAPLSQPHSYARIDFNFESNKLKN